MSGKGEMGEEGGGGGENEKRVHLQIYCVVINLYLLHELFVLYKAELYMYEKRCWSSKWQKLRSMNCISTVPQFNSQEKS